MEIVHVSSRGQIVIPERIRKRMKLERGDRLILFETEKGILMEREDRVERELEERKGWLTLAEKSFEEIWDNEKDERIWREYI